jgi:hypothetical protein
VSLVERGESVDDGGRCGNSAGRRPDALWRQADFDVDELLVPLGTGVPFDPFALLLGVEVLLDPLAAGTGVPFEPLAAAPELDSDELDAAPAELLAAARESVR